MSKALLTMFPISVVPRAKKKMIGLQPPVLYSFDVVPTDCLVSIGLADMRPARRDTIRTLAFMFKSGVSGADVKLKMKYVVGKM